uniref:hypothetical protein n=1 Tax=Haloprofundus sp. MHR1 TaxID=2572921 RepID=UPI001F1B8252|nr:hypothetical protein [Haloprofundus sp. MHR1]
MTADTPVVTAISHAEDRLIAAHVADAAVITPTAAGESITVSREEFIASEIEPLSQDLDTAYEAFE